MNNKMQRERYSTGDLLSSRIRNTKIIGNSSNKNAQWNASSSGKNAQWKGKAVDDSSRPKLASTLGRPKSSSNLLSARNMNRSRSRRRLNGSGNTSNKKSAASILKELDPTPKPRPKHNTDSFEDSQSNHSFSGFHPHDSNTDDNVGLLSELDLSFVDQQDSNKNNNANGNSTSPLSRPSFHGFLQSKRETKSKSIRQRSRSHDSYFSLCSWTHCSPWQTLAKKLHYLQTETIFGRNITYLTKSTTFGRNLTAIAQWMCGSTTNNAGMDDSQQRRRRLQEEHYLVTYLQNVSDQSRTLASNAPQEDTRRSWWFS